MTRREHTALILKEMAIMATITFLGTILTLAGLKNNSNADAKYFLLLIGATVASGTAFFQVFNIYVTWRYKIRKKYAFITGQISDRKITKPTNIKTLLRGLAIIAGITFIALLVTMFSLDNPPFSDNIRLLMCGLVTTGLGCLSQLFYLYSAWSFYQFDRRFGQLDNA